MGLVCRSNVFCFVYLFRISIVNRNKPKTILSLLDVFIQYNVTFIIFSNFKVTIFDLRPGHHQTYALFRTYKKIYRIVRNALCMEV